MDKVGPKCACGVPALYRECKKLGPNKGRPFWSCDRGYCRFFESADGRPWIRGVTVGTVFRPFKRFLADPSIQKEYSLVPPDKTTLLNLHGVEWMHKVIAPYQDAEDEGPEGHEVPKERIKYPKFITSLRIFPHLKLIRGGPTTIRVMRRSETNPESGYRYHIANISVETGKLSGIETRDEDCIDLIVEFVEGLATDPKKTLADMGKKMGTCCICGKNLTDADSMANGYGKICGEKCSF